MKLVKNSEFWFWRLSQLWASLVAALLAALVAFGISTVVFSSYFRKSTSIDIGAEASLLPESPLGDLLLSEVVESAPDGEGFVVQSILGLNLEIRAGRMVIMGERTVLSRLEVSEVASGKILIAGRNVPVVNGTLRSSDHSMNCSFRLDVTTSSSLAQKGKVILLLESWTERSDGEPCRLRFSAGRSGLFSASSQGDDFREIQDNITLAP